MIFFKIGKNSFTELAFTKVKRMSDNELSSWISTPMSFIQIEFDLSRLTSEIDMIYERSYTIMRKKKTMKHLRWFYPPELVELLALIRKSKPSERNKIKNRYTNVMRRIKVKNLEPMPVNMTRNMLRKKDKPIKIDISSKPCHNEKIIANEFAQYVLMKKYIQTKALEPQVSEGYCDHH